MEKTMLKNVAIIFCLFVVTACSTLFGPVAEKIASGVEKYCEEPYSYRSVYRNTVNSKLVMTGHKVHVHCSGDPADTSEPE